MKIYRPFALLTLGLALAVACDKKSPTSPTTNPPPTTTTPAAVTLSALAISPATMVAGGSVQGTATLSAAAPTGGLVVTLSAPAGAPATVPASVTVAAGATSATFMIATRTVTAITDIVVSGSGGGETRTASLRVTPVPALAALAANVLEVVGANPAVVTVTLNGAAPAGGTVVTLSSNDPIASVPASFTIPAGATSGTFTVTTERTGRSHIVTITVTVGGVTQTLELRVSPVLPEVPTLGAVSPTGASVGDTVAVTLTGDDFVAGWGITVDVSGGGVTVSNLRVTSRSSITATFTIAPTAVTGERAVTVTLAGRASAPQAFTVIGAGAPVADNDSYSTAEDAALTVAAPGVLVGDTDVNGDALTAVLSTGPSSGSLTLNANGSFTYTPNANFSGSDSFTYRANDGTANSNVATVTITVGGDNDAPAAGNDSYATNEDAALNVAASGVLGNDTDADGNTLTAVVATNPSSGALTLNANGSFTYTPNANFNGSDSFTYRANDGAANSNTATVTLTVNGVNDAPAFTGGGNQTVNEDIGNQSVAGWATAVSAGPSEGSQAVSFMVTGNTNSALFSSGPAVASDGTLTYRPADNAAGTATITLRAQDDGGTANGGADSSATQTFTITVNQLLDDQTTFNFTAPGGPQDFVVPAGVTSVRIEASGAQGGTSNLNGPAGNGGSVTATVSVVSGETLSIRVGGQGGNGQAGVAGAAGFNAAGSGGAGSTASGGGGGGASDVRQGGSALVNRVVVAGGGGGGGAQNVGAGGAGGDLTGANGASDMAGGGIGGGGGTQAGGGAGGAGQGGCDAGSAGSIGAGGTGGANCSDSGGGGGGGYHGGGGGGASLNFSAGAGGGGSSFTIAAATNVTHVQGNRSGNGIVIIRY